MRVYHISSFLSVSVLFPLYEGCIRDAANIWHWAISTLFVSGLTVGRVQASINSKTFCQHRKDMDRRFSPYCMMLWRLRGYGFILTPPIQYMDRCEDSRGRLLRPLMCSCHWAAYQFAPGSKPFFEPVFHFCDGGVGSRNEGKSKLTGDVAATGQEGFDAGGIAVDTHEMIEFAETAM